MKKPILLLLISLGISVMGFAQRNVTGKVTSSEDGEPLPGVNVVVKGTTNGTITDVEGIYNILCASKEKFNVLLWKRSLLLDMVRFEKVILQDRSQP